MSIPTVEDPAARLAYLRKVQRRLEAELADLEQEVRPNRGTRKAALCGTDSGYYRHRRMFGERPCAACKRAHAEVNRMKAQARRERPGGDD